MNTGAFGEGFPYSNFHELNMDWIIKIAKDFLDQYSHIQETITTGLEDLDSKATELEGLLQQWYDTHSEDIAEELANALTDLNNWYTEHEDMLDQYVTDSINEFNQSADDKAERTIASIPDDYSTLAGKVQKLYNGSLPINIQNALNNGYRFITAYLSTGLTGNVGDTLNIIYGVSLRDSICIDLNNGVSELYISMNTYSNMPWYVITDNDMEILVTENGNGLKTKTFTISDIPSDARYIFFQSNRTDIESATLTIFFDNVGTQNQIYNNVDLLNTALSKTATLPYTIRNNVYAYVNNQWVLFTDNDSFIYDVEGAEIIEITAHRPVNVYFAIVAYLDANNQIIGGARESGGDAEITRHYTLPQNTKYVALFHYRANPESDTSLIAHFRGDAFNNQSLKNISNNLYGHWFGNTFAWFGTSIPAGQGNNNYPKMVGDILNAKVYNECVGSSPAHCRQRNRVSSSNPYGFISNFSAVSRCLSNSITEMQWVIDNWNSGVFTEEVPDAMTDDLRAFILNNSYENKLLKYFDIRYYAKLPDIFIFNHGFNDIMDYEDEYKTTYKLNGTYVNLAYQYVAGRDTAPVTVPGGRVEFDVTNIDYVEYTSFRTQYLDAWDLFNGTTFVNSSGMQYGNSGVSHGIIDTRNATTLALSIIDQTHESDVSAYNYEYFTDKFTYNGAMNFLISQIKSRSPKSRIAIIGEYADETRPLVAPEQERVADRWDLPLYKQWDMLQMAQCYYWTTWGWVNGEFKKDAYPTGHYISDIGAYLADGVHPHSDASGKTNMYIAKNMAKWLDTIYKFETE